MITNIVQVSGKDEVYFSLYSYPVFVTCEACVLLRVTVFDYQRVLQVSVSHNYPHSQALLMVQGRTLE